VFRGKCREPDACAPALDSPLSALDSSASPMGFEPTISCVTGRRALQAAPRGQNEFQISKFLMTNALSRSSFGFRHSSFPSSPGWTRTTVCLLVRKLPLPLGHRTVFSGSRGTRTPKSRMRPTVFKTAPSSSQMTSVSCGSWDRTNIATFKASNPAVRRPRSRARSVEQKERGAWSETSFLPAPCPLLRALASCGGRN
jgi:hypothetical protein